MAQISIQRATGEALNRYIPDLARLRIDVFRDFPYLYDGSLEYEQNYLKSYANVPGSVIVLALDADKVVGASTGLPMDSEPDYVQEPFRQHGYDPSHVFYFGESVLIQGYRGHGIGVRFFQEREAHARALGGFDITCFCAVERPPTHPSRPADYVALDAFWARRGYRKHPELRTAFSWREVGEAQETEKPMVFWLKPCQSPN